MTPPEPPRRPRAPSLGGIVTPDQPTKQAVRNHPGVEGHEQSAPRKSPTLTGLVAPPAPGSVAPPAPGVPLEYAATKRPPLPWGRTMRAPTPPSTMAAARRSDPPAGAESPAAGIRISSDETPRSEPPGPSVEPDLRSALAAAEKRNQELERRERVRVEAAGPNSWPPKVQRSQSPVPSSSPEAKVDRAIGGTVRLLLARFGWPALAALGIGGAALKPTADPVKTDATLAIVEGMRADVALIREQLSGVIRREAARDAYLRCVDEGMVDLGQQLLPAVDRQGNAQPLRAFVDRCQRLRP